MSLNYYAGLKKADWSHTKATEAVVTLRPTMNL